MQQKNALFMRRLLLIILLLIFLSTSSVDALNLTLIGDVYRWIRQIKRENRQYTIDIKNKDLLNEYDFIVVGAGTAGATLTNRLTEVGEWKVLLLEAGGEEQAIVEIPLMHAHMQLTDYSWGYRAQPQDNACLGLNDRRCNFPQGKGMGGTSLINAMMFTRGHRRDYDEWARLGNEGWSWDEVLPYFKKSERARGDFANPEFHGLYGELSIENSPYRSPLLDAWLESASEFGYSLVDYNSGDELGFSVMQANLRNGSRCSSNRAFLRPISHRKNLHVAKYAEVTKVIILPGTNKVIGVEFYRQGKFKVVKARKEVILSAGAINTPKLLMLSGIGPKEHLESLNIPVIYDSPGVGQNLQDHVAMSGLAFVIDANITIIENRLLQRTAQVFAEYYLYNNGPGTSLGGIEGIAYVRTPVAKTPSDYPDIELIFASASLASDDGRVVRRGIGVTDEIYNAVYKPLNNKNAFTIWPMVTRQNSRGWVKLRSKNPFRWPIMYGNYFDDEHDLITLVEGIKFAVAITRSEAFQKFGAKLHDIPIPACKYYVFESDEYWTCVARQLTSTLHHFCGTAKMGTENDEMAVVNHQLKVYGVSGLRVIDASIVPVIPAAHTNAIAFMIGEKGADLIKAQYGKLNEKSYVG